MAAVKSPGGPSKVKEFYYKGVSYADDANRPSPRAKGGSCSVHSPETVIHFRCHSCDGWHRHLAGLIKCVEVRMIIEQLGTEEILVEWDRLNNLIADCRDKLGRLEYRVNQIMDENGADSIPSEVYICEKKKGYQYNQLGLTPLKEVFNASDLEKALIPAHTEEQEIPDKWVTTTVLSLAAKYGTEALRIVDQSRTRTRGIRFARRPE